MVYLKSEEIRNELVELINDNRFTEWYEIVEPILLNEEFQKRRLFMHHQDSTVWTHSISVSFKAYRYALKIKADARICAIAGLLHDFYPRAWVYSEELEKLDPYYVSRINEKESLFKKHGFTHGREAKENYIKYFSELEDKKISDSIKCHMFPLTIKPPRYREGWIVTVADKVDSLSSIRFIVKNVIKGGKK